MDTQTLFATQFALSLIAFSLLARWYVAPWLAKQETNDAFSLLLFPHAFRHIGLAFLVPGLVGEGLSESFAAEAAYGDLVAGLLALVSIVALQQNFHYALGLVAVANVVGFFDLVNALSQASVIPHLGAAWFIPTFIVPVLLVTHGVILARLYCLTRQRLFGDQRCSRAAATVGVEMT